MIVVDFFLGVKYVLIYYWNFYVSHFPTFPVLPGVLMLQGLTEAAAWLVRDAQDFASSVILLRQAKNVTYKSFVKPGHLLRIEVTCRRIEADESDFDGVGFCEETEVVRARFSLRHSCIGTQSVPSAVDKALVAGLREEFAYLKGG